MPSEKTKTSAEEYFGVVMQIVFGASHALGWNPDTGTSDRKEWRHATIDVKRPEILEAATIDTAISADKSVRVTMHPKTKNRAGLALLKERIDEDLKAVGIAQQPIPGSPMNNPPPPTQTIQARGVAVLEHMLRRFHVAAKQLETRRENRPTIKIADEYDVQDLLHGMLKLMFDDVRPEDPVASYAGSASRVDFVLKAEQIVLEVKFVRATLSDKQIGEQLVIDVHRYRSHADCKLLMCFVYDPDRHLKNPRGIEADLTRMHETLDVRVLIMPT
jgi:hypothetical protein